MDALSFWKTMTRDRSDFLERVMQLLHETGVRYCVIGGQAVNAYAEPVVSLDLDLVVASDQIPEIENALMEHFQVKRFEHSLNVSAPDSDLRVQIQLDLRYASFVERAKPEEVLGVPMYVASLEDVLQGKMWAAMDPTRRASKRYKDLADISRLLEAHPELISKVPLELRERLL